MSRQKGFSIVWFILVVFLILAVFIIFKEKPSYEPPLIQESRVEQINQGLVKGWSFKVDLAFSPTYSEGVVYFGSDDGYFYALNAENGELKWKFQPKGRVDTYIGGEYSDQITERRVRSKPIIIGDVVFFRSFDNYVYALNKNSGDEVWNYLISGKHDFDSSLFSNGLNIYVFNNEWTQIVAINGKDGKKLWESSFESPLSLISDEDMFKDEIYVADYNRNFYAINSLTGDKKLEFNLKDIKSEIFSPIIKRGSIYYFGYDNNLYSYDSSKRILNKNFAFPEPTNSFAVDEKAVYLSSSGGTEVFAVDEMTGRIFWQFQNPKLALAEIAVSGNAVYAIGDELFVLDINNGQALWNYPVELNPNGSIPEITDNQLFVGGSEGLFSFKLTSN